MKQRNNSAEDTRKMFDQDAEDESYKRHKHIQYRNLVVKALLAFALGLLFDFIIAQ